MNKGMQALIAFCAVVFVVLIVYTVVAALAGISLPTEFVEFMKQPITQMHRSELYFMALVIVLLCGK